MVAPKVRDRRMRIDAKREKRNGLVFGRLSQARNGEKTTVSRETQKTQMNADTLRSDGRLSSYACTPAESESRDE
jgi:hypothetical protein